MFTPRHSRHFRPTLAISTALASGCLAASAGAQSLPGRNDATIVAFSQLGGAPGIGRSGSTLTVDLKSTSTVIDWNGFNVPAGATAEFKDSRDIALSRNIAVLNRDMSGANTQIRGTLRSSQNVAVWIYNPNGILVGGNARINTGSLVLTTLNPDQGNFMAGGDLGGRYGLTGTSGDIAIGPDVTITVSEGNRGLIMVAPKIESNGTLTAGNQDVAFVTASDVTLNYGVGSPLSVTLNKGTAVAGNSQLVRGIVGGRNIVFALASQASVTDALLQVDASVVSASNGDNGVILSAGRGVGSVTLGTAADTAGLVGVAGAGGLRARTDSVAVAANGTVALTGALNAGRDVAITAGRAVRVANAVTAGNDYRVAGASVALGGASAVTQAAGNAVEIIATNATLAAASGLTLRSNADGNGSNSGTLTLRTTGSTDGDIAFAPGSRLEGGPARQSDVRIDLRSAANAVSLGDVSARNLQSTAAGGAFANGLTGGNLTVGDVTTQAALALTAGGTIGAGTLVSSAGISLTSAGLLKVAGIDASGDVALGGTGATQVVGTLLTRGAARDIAILRSGDVSIGGAITAGRDLTIGTTAAPAASITLGGAAQARNIAFVSSGGQTFAGTLNATGTLSANAGGTLTAGTMNASDAIALNAASLTLTSVTGGRDVSLTATGGAIAGTTPAGVRLSANRALAATASNGSVTVLSATTNTGALRLIGATGVNAGTLLSGNDISVDAGSAAAIVSGSVTSSGNYAVSGGSVTLGSAAPVTQKATGAVTITAGAGGITGLSGLGLYADADGAGRETLELVIADTTAGSIAFAPSTLLNGGLNQRSDVVIRSGLASGSVTLGNVVASNLLGAIGTAAASPGIVRTSALTVGNVTVAGPLSLSGAGLTTGNLTMGGVTTLDSSADLTSGAIDSTGRLQANAAGALTVAAVRGGADAALSATGALVVTGPVSTTGALSLTGAGLTTGNLTAGGATTLQSSADLTSGAIDSTGQLQANAGGVLSVASVRGGADAALSATAGLVVTGSVSTTGALSLTGAGLTTGNLTAGGATTLQSSVDLTSGAIDSTGQLRAKAAGVLSVGSVRGGADAALSATGALVVTGPVSTTGALSLTGAGLTTGNLTAGGATTLQSSADLTSGAIDSTGRLQANAAGVLTVGSVRGGADVALSATGALVVTGPVSTPGAVTLSGAGLTAGSVTGGAGVTLESTAGLALGAIDSAGTVSARSAGGLALGSASGATGVRLSSTAGDVDVSGALRAASGDVTIDATAGAVRLPGSVTAGGNYNATGQRITLGGAQSATGSVTIAATAGAVQGLSGLTLMSGSDGQGGAPLSLSGSAGVALAANTTLLGGSAQQDAVAIDGGGAAITLGDVTARSLTVDGGRRLSNAFAAGTVSLIDTITLSTGSAGLRLGAVSVSGGGLALDSVDGPIALGAIRTAGDVTLSGARIDYATIVGGAVDMRSVGTAATGIGGGTIDGRGPVTVTAVDGVGGVVTGAITTPSNLSVRSVGEIRLDGVDVDGTAGLTTIGNPADILIVNGLTAGGDVTIASTRDVRTPFITSTGGSLSISAPNGDVSGFVPGTITQLSAGQGGGYALDVGHAVRLGALTGGPISLRADVIEVQSIDIGTNSVKMFADSGDLTIRNGVTAGAVDLRASGALSIGGAIDASGAVTLAGTERLTFDAIRGSSVAANSGGRLSGRMVSSNGAIDLVGASIGIGALTSTTGAVAFAATAGRLDAGTVTAATGFSATADGTLSVDALTVSNGGASLTSTTGDARIGSGVTRGDLVVRAAGLVASPGAISAGGVYDLAGGAIALGGGVTQTAGGRITLTTTQGAIAAGPGTTLTGNGTILVDSASTIDLAGTVLQSRDGGALGLRASAGRSATLGDVDAGLVGGIATAADGTRSASALFAHDAAFTAGTIRARDIGVALSAGDLSAGAVTTTGATRLSAKETVAVGAIDADTIAIDAGGAVTGGVYRAVGENRVAGGSIALSRLESTTGQAAAVARVAGVAIDSIVAGGLASMTAPGAIQVRTIAANGLAADGGGAVSGATYAIGGAASIAGASIGLDTLTTGAGATSLIARGGDLSVGQMRSGGDAKLTGTGAIALGTLMAGTLALNAGGAMSGGTFATAGATLLTARSITLDGSTSGAAGIVVTARGGDLTIGRVDSTGAARLTGSNGVGVTTLVADALNVEAGGAVSGGSYTTTGAATLSGQSIGIAALESREAAITAKATGGALAIGRLAAKGLATVTGTNAVTVDTLDAQALTLDAGGLVSGGTFTVSGGTSVVGASVALTGLVSQGGDVAATARTGDVRVDRLAAGGRAAVTAPGGVVIGQFSAKGTGTITGGAGGVRLDAADAGTLAIKSAGDIGGWSTAGPVLTAAGDLIVTGDRAVTLTSASGGGVTVTGTEVRATGGLTAARALLVEARNALTLGDATAGGTVSLSAAEGLGAQAVKAGGDATLKAGAGLTVAAVDSGGTLGVSAGGDVAIGTGRATGAATIDAVGVATLGQMIAGPSLSIKASDARLTGTQRAASVTFENRSGDTAALRLGDGAGADGFQLSDAEVKLVEADTLVFRQGKGAVEIGTLGFDADAGRRSVDVLGTGRMTISGVVSGAGVGRTFRFGGASGSDSAMASVLNVAANSTAGGRLLFDGVNLDLRGNRIAVGLGNGFIDRLADTAGAAEVGASLVGNGNSVLYNANLGGGFYDPTALVTVSARTLTVRYGDYALFQNTGLARTSSGAVLGGTPGAPVSPALTLIPANAVNSFALFGTLNGVGATAAALLGSSAVSTGTANLSASRINGCLVGSGAGCLTAIVIQPTLQVFTVSQEDVFGAVADLSVPFDPLVGGANEDLLTGLAALAPRSDESDRKEKTK